MGHTSFPQAPMCGPSREALIKILLRSDAEKHLPIILAKYSPDAIVRKEGNLWVIRALVEDSKAVQKAFKVAQKNNKNFMDENIWCFRYPGPSLIEASTKEDFICSIKKMPWDYGEEDGRGETPFLRQ